MWARVEAARERVRFAVAVGEAAAEIACNADMRPADVRKYRKLDEAANALIRMPMA